MAAIKPLVLVTLYFSKRPETFNTRKTDREVKGEYLSQHLARPGSDIRDKAKEITKLTQNTKNSVLTLIKSDQPTNPVRGAHPTSCQTAQDKHALTA